VQRIILTSLVAVGLALAANPARAQATDADLFAAMNLFHLPEAVPLPKVSLSDPDGNQVTFESFEGKVVLLNFWTTW
jgi:cytochrome oxidase Cu insertion factor (SCO1/SenC/PrrC family)